MPQHDSRHHRKCRSNGGNSERRNISNVSQNEHRAYHTLFANKDAYGIAKTLNEIWIDPSFQLVVTKKALN